MERGKREKVKKQETIKTVKHYFGVMERVYWAIIVLALVSVSSFGISFYTLIDKQSDSNKIANQIILQIKPDLNNLNNKLSDINDALWLESEQHFLDVMNKVDDSVVAVLAYPASKDNTGLADVVYTDKVYTDNKGMEWSVGTGFSITDEGYILTARHIVNNAQLVVIISKNGTSKEVKKSELDFTGGSLKVKENVILFDNADLAVIKINSGVPKVDLLDSDSIGVGSKIGFIGFPFVDINSNIRTKTTGTISAIAGLNGVSVYVINSFINNGNSGGPVFSLKTGKVIGIINADFSNKKGIGIVTALNKKNLGLTN